MRIRKERINLRNNFSIVVIDGLNILHLMRKIVLTHPRFENHQKEMQSAKHTSENTLLCDDIQVFQKDMTQCVNLLVEIMENCLASGSVVHFVYKSFGGKFSHMKTFELLFKRITARSKLFFIMSCTKSRSSDKECDDRAAIQLAMDYRTRCRKGWFDDLNLREDNIVLISDDLYRSIGSHFELETHCVHTGNYPPHKEFRNHPSAAYLKGYKKSGAISLLEKNKYCLSVFYHPRDGFDALLTD